MNKKDFEDLVGESMEDMGLEEYIEEIECEDCFKLIKEETTRSICNDCWSREIS